MKRIPARRFLNDHLSYVKARRSDIGRCPVNPRRRRRRRRGGNPLFLPSRGRAASVGRKSGPGVRPLQ